MAGQMYTLTRTRHQVAPGQPPQEPELLESYIAGPEGESWTGGYLRHVIGQSEVVSEHVARIVMGDRELRKHYSCEPPIPVAAPTVIEERHEGTIAAPADDDDSA